MTEESTKTTKQIRPRIRKTNHRQPNAEPAVDGNGSGNGVGFDSVVVLGSSGGTTITDDEGNKNGNKPTVGPVEDVTERMNSWMGLNNSSCSSISSTQKKNKQDTNTIAKGGKGKVKQILSKKSLEGGEKGTEETKEKEPVVNVTKQSGTTTTKIGNNSGPTSILKTPKYSGKATIATTVGTSTQNKETKEGKGHHVISSSKPVICKDVIMERDPTRRPPKRKTKNNNKTRTNNSVQYSSSDYNAIEGFIPSTTNNGTVLPSSSPSPSSVSPSPTKATPMSGADSTTTKVPPTHETSATNNKKDTANDDDDNNNKHDDDDDAPTASSSSSSSQSSPLILSSVEELFQATGHEMPSNPTKITYDTQLVEAELAFSVMTQQQYDGKLAELKRQQVADREEQCKMFLGQDNIFDNNDNDDDSDEGSDGSDDDDDDLMEMLMEQNLDDDDDDDDDTERIHQPRAFRKLWDALSSWTTPEAVEYMTQLENSKKDEKESNDEAFVSTTNQTVLQVDRSDIGASRCAGLMAMIKMYLPTGMKELNISIDMKRTIEKRLGNLLRTFNYSQEAPKLDVTMWKAMTCILLDIVVIETKMETKVPTTTTTTTTTTITNNNNNNNSNNNVVTTSVLPSSAVTVGLTISEYQYITRSAIQTFSY